jgi:hypothetical protein
MVIQPIFGGTDNKKTVNNTVGKGIAPLIPTTAPVLERKKTQVAPQAPQPTQQNQNFGEGVKKFGARTAVSFADMVSEGLEFATNFIARNPIFVGKQILKQNNLAAGVAIELAEIVKPELKKKSEEVQNKWRDIYKVAQSTGRLPQTQLRKEIDKIQETEYIKPSKEWSSAPLKDKLTTKLGETLAILGPNIIPSFALYAVHPAVGLGVAVSSTANEIEREAIKYGVEDNKAEKLALVSGIAIGALDRIVPDEIFSSSQKASFAKEFIKRVVLNSLKEGGTEVTQEGLQVAAEATFRKDLGLDEIATRFAMSALAGVFGGGGATTIMGTINNAINRDILESPNMPQEKIEPVEAPAEQVQPTQIIEPIQPVNPSVVKVAEIPVEGKKLVVEEPKPQKVAEGENMVEQPPITEKNIGEVKTTKDVRKTLSKVREEYQSLITEAEAKAIIAEGKREGLNTKNIAQLKRIYAKSSKFQEGDIETIRNSPSRKLVNTVIENVQEMNPDMSEQEAFDFALELPTKAETKVVKNQYIKDLQQKEKVLSKYLVDLKEKQKSLELKDDAELDKEWRIAMAKQEQLEKIIGVAAGQLPVGEGKIKASRLEARITEQLDKLDQETIDQIGVATYNQMNKKENISRAVDYVSNNQEEAIKVLTGEISPPDGILRNSIYIALENAAGEDVELARRIASLASTRLGQEISILSEANPDSPVRIMRDIIKIREEAFKKKFGGKSAKEAKDKIVSDIKNNVEVPNKKAWANFLKEIEC